MKTHIVLYTLIGVLWISISFNNAVAQNGFRAGTADQGWGLGWSTTDYWSGTGFGTTFGKTYQNTLGAGNRYFRLYTDWSNNQREHGPSGGNDLQVNLNTKLSLQTWGGSKAYYINVANATDRYIFRTRFGDGINNAPELVVFKVEGEIRTVSLVSQMPTATAVTATAPVTVTSNISGPLATGQSVYLRYTINNWSSSVIVPMTGSNINYNAQIPAQPSGTTVKYYIFTSGAGLTISHSDADLFTINGNTNNGNNFQYTVLAGNSAVTLNPSYPTDNQMVTLTFDATGTALEGANKVYLHSGVSATQSNPTLFQYTKGNWGQDDGIGLMTSMGGNNWSITLTSLRSYYNVPIDKDIFGLNLLFRNANGTLKEDLNGANYYFAVNPGSFFNITFPTVNHYFTPVGQAVNHTAQANDVPNSWILKEIDPITDVDISTLHTQTGGLSFLHNIPVTNTSVRKYKLTADFGGNQKFKTFLLQGYNPIGEAPRPFLDPGIHYHPNDPTKATLILHAPTFTTFKNGNGVTTGISNTAPKTTVYVVGDFNNWTPSEAYKLFKDRDGWDGSIDVDNDGDRGDYWWITLEGLNPGQEYVFQYLIDGSIRVADPYTHKVSDPDDGQIPPTVYPNLITYRPQAVDRASVLQTNQQPYNWEADPFTKPTDNNLNIYELHFRDFTEEGTYLKAIEKLDYIKGLGINAIHVMPVSEFEGNSSWGYNPNFYFAADKAYGTANDLKKFIDECHKRKIQVFNDLVLNHAFYSNVMAKMYWNSSQNKPANDNPWFNPDHKMVADPAGWWGADWNHESEHTQKMIDRALDYWLQEFKFDGYRFDFTKGFGQTAPDAGDPWASSYDQNRIDLLQRMFIGMKTRNPGSVVIFEHLAWATEDKVLADQGVLMWSGVGHHNDMKGLILGYNQDNTNIYESGVFNTTARNFQFANWMSYAESHDEQRLAHEVKLFFNWSAFSGPKVTSSDSLRAIVDRLKISLGFNLLLPGPRMIWQFQELGYDYSINFNGRTGEKPVRWDYYDNATRKELYNLASKLLKVRNRHNIYNTTPDYGNIGLGAGNIHIPRVMRLSSGSGASAKHVIVVANIDPTNSRNVFPSYDVTGTWYRYNGNPAFDGTTINVSNVNAAYGLAPSEMVVFTNFPIDECTDVRNNNDNGAFSLRNAIQCAQDNDVIFIEYPVYDQTIVLSTPIEIDKNITIDGFPSKKINISGSSFSQPVISIVSGKTVTINGVTIACSQGGAQGRCLLNQGALTLDHVDMSDLNGTASGSSIFNEGSGTVIIKGQNMIKKQ